MAVRTPDITGGAGGELLKGSADGFTVIQDTTTRVIIRAGVYEADGILFTLDADTTHTLTGLLSAFDNHHIYLDKSASTPASPVFFDESETLAVPVRDTTKNGFYHPVTTEDRLVGTITSSSGVATITDTMIAGRNQNIVSELGLLACPFLTVNLNPSSVWQNMNVNFSSAILPVNAVKLRFNILNTDSVLLSLFVGAAEVSPLSGSVANAQWEAVGFSRVDQMGWVNLGPSRDVRVTGANDDNNSLRLLCTGYEYER